MKKKFAVILACVLCLALCGCLAAVPEDPLESTGNSIPATLPEDSSAPTQDSDPEPPEPVHCHSWQDATCTDPEICADCGDTRGSPLGHSWQDASCNQPKTCKTCGETEGDAIGHSYRGGKCTRCAAADPSAEEMVWIPTNGGTKYHSRASCSNMKDPQQVPLSEAKAQGFTPCKRCH